ncbi:MAG: hypothetical protein KDD69_11835, partial [Bdellovibrionales bacterium]|nr:hypothetical protein [Bdellovibrionales bacterium]
TAYLIEQLFAHFGMTPSVAAAQLLLAGLMDDTGSFRYSNATVAAFDCAARLVAQGAAPEHIANILYFSLPERVLRLRAMAFNGLALLLEGRLAVIAVTDDMLQSCKADASDTEGVVELARSIEGTVAAAFLREIDSGWKVSLRSKDPRVNVNTIAGRFGGGGHPAAAGCRMQGSRDDVEQVLSGLFSEAFAQAGLSPLTR